MRNLENHFHFETSLESERQEDHGRRSKTIEVRVPSFVSNPLPWSVRTDRITLEQEPVRMLLYLKYYIHGRVLLPSKSFLNSKAPCLPKQRTVPLTFDWLQLHLRYRRRERLQIRIPTHSHNRIRRMARDSEITEPFSRFGN